MVLLPFRIKSQPGIAYKSVAYKKACNVVLQSSKYEEITLSHGFIFVFISYFLGGDIGKRMFAKVESLEKKDKKRGLLKRRGLSIDGEWVQTFYTLWYEF